MARLNDDGRRAIGVVIAGALIAAVTAFYVLSVYFPSFNAKETPIAGVVPARTELPRTPGLARRVVVVVADGVSFDHARALAELGPVRREGVFRPIRVSFPTYTSPAIIAFLRGLPPRDSGVRLNGEDLGVPSLDSVLTTADAAGIPIRVRSRGWDPFIHLLAPPARADVRPIRVGLVAELVRQRLAGSSELPLVDGKSPARALDFIYLSYADDAGHKYGAKSPEYERACRDAGAAIAMIARSIDLDQDAIVAVSDHGHLPEGGHGGVEPEVSRAFFLAAGAVFRRGVTIGERPAHDVAPTLALLAGAAPLRTSAGMPMMDALALDDDLGALLLAAPFDQASRFSCALRADPRCAQAAKLVERLSRADRDAPREAEELFAALERSRSIALDAAYEARAIPRRAIAAIPAILALGALFYALRRRSIGWPRDVSAASFALVIINALVLFGYLAARGYGPSFSRIRDSFQGDALPGAVIAAIVTAIAARLLRAPKLSPWVVLIAPSASFFALAAYVGADTRAPPPPLAGILVFEVSPLIVSAALGASLIALARAVNLRASAGDFF